VSPNAPSKKISTEHQYVLDQLKQRSGLIFPETRLGEITALLEKSARAAGLTGAEYACHLVSNQAAFDDLCNQVTIAETYFFRDPKQFDFVREHVIPIWKSPEQTFPNSSKFPGVSSVEPRWHAWSAGCSTGEEAYSLAILFDQEGIGSSVKISATDLNKQSLATAEAAHYGSWSLRTANQDFRQRYFDHKDDRFFLKQKFVSPVNFAHLNLVSPIAPGNIFGLGYLDLIFCRNVFIYFDVAAITRVLETFYSLLKPGGFLVLGPSDPPATQFVNFEAVTGPWGVFYKKGDGKSSSSASVSKGRNDPFKSVSAPPAVSGKHFSTRKHQLEINRLPSITAPSIDKEIAGPLSTNLSSLETTNKARNDKNKDNSAKDNKNKDSNLSDAQTRSEVAKTSVLKLAEQAYNAGQYEKAFDLSGQVLQDPQAAILHIKALANFKGAAPAEKVLARLLQQHVNNFQLYYLHGHLLFDLGQLETARGAFKSALFLDSRDLMAHYSLALVQKKLVDKAGAKRSFRNVIELGKNQSPDQLLPFGDGQTVKSVMTAAGDELRNLSDNNTD